MEDPVFLRSVTPFTGVTVVCDMEEGPLCLGFPSMLPHLRGLSLICPKKEAG